MGQETIYRCDRGGCEETTDSPEDDGWEIVPRVVETDIIARKRFYYCPGCENYTPPREPFHESVDDLENNYSEEVWVVSVEGHNYYDVLDVYRDEPENPSEEYNTSENEEIVIDRRDVLAVSGNR